MSASLRTLFSPVAVGVPHTRTSIPSLQSTLSSSQHHLRWFFRRSNTTFISFLFPTSCYVCISADFSTSASSSSDSVLLQTDDHALLFSSLIFGQSPPPIAVDKSDGRRKDFLSDFSSESGRVSTFRAFVWIEYRDDFSNVDQLTQTAWLTDSAHDENLFAIVCESRLRSELSAFSVAARTLVSKRCVERP